MPFFIYWPAGGLTGGLEIDGLTAHIDVMPTLLNLVGAGAPLDELQGNDLTPLLTGSGAAADRFSFASALPQETASIAVQDSTVKLIIDLENGRHQLFELTHDPGELHDVAGERVDQVDRMRRIVESHLDALEDYPAYRPTPTPLSDEDIERLRSLGYVR